MLGFALITSLAYGSDIYQRWAGDIYQTWAGFLQHGSLLLNCCFFVGLLIAGMLLYKQAFVIIKFANLLLKKQFFAIFKSTESLFCC